MKHIAMVAIACTLVLATISGCTESPPQAKTEATKEYAPGFYSFRVHLINADDGHQYVVADTADSSGGLAITHAAGCKTCKKHNE